MRAAQINKRVARLERRIGPNDNRQFTLEELCWMLWRRDKRRFLSLANGDCYNLRAFVPMFERRDAERPVLLRQASSNLIR
jgi:hypothetical protein